MNTTLLSISGGLDSTYVLYQWLKRHKKERILLHHIRLRHDVENRLEPELKAVHNIMDWLKSNGYNNFDYHESGFDYGTLPYIMIKDIQVVSMFTAIILKTQKWKTINTLLLSWHLGEVNRDDINKGFRVRKILEAMEVKRKIEFEFPIQYLSRADMAASMPKELLDLTHSCRKPENGNCMKCKTCLEMIEAGIY